MKFSLKKLIPTFVRRNLPPDKLMLNPKKDWKTIVIIFSAVNLLIIVFNLYFFQKMSSGEFFEVPMEETVSIESINKKILVEIVNQYETRQTSFEELRLSSKIFADPS